MKIFKTVILLSLSMLCFTACLVDNDAEKLAENVTLFGFSQGNSDVNVVLLPANDSDISYSAEVVLLGGNNGEYPDEQVQIKYSIDPSSTAIEGTHFTIDTDTDMLVMENGIISTLPYTIKAGNYAIEDDNFLIINLTEVISSVDGVISDFNKQLKVNIVKCNPTLIGAYTAGNTVNGSSNGDGESVNVVALGCNTYRASNLPNFNGVFTWDFILNDDNTIELTGLLDSNLEGLDITGEGLLLENGTIRITKMDVAGTNTGIDMSFDLIPNK